MKERGYGEKYTFVERGLIGDAHGFLYMETWKHRDIEV